jgi:thiol-disulfide isomerase/thioredoxin
MTLLSYLAAGSGRASCPQSNSPTPSNKVGPADVAPAKPRDKEQDASEKQPSERTEGKPKTAAEQYKDLANESNQALGKLSAALERAKTEEEKKALTKQFQELRAVYANRFLELAAKNRKDPSVVKVQDIEGKERGVPAKWLALVWFTSNADPEKDRAGFDKAIKIIFDDYAQEIMITGVLTNGSLVRAAERLPDFEDRLRSIAEKHPRPQARGAACLVLAQHLIRQIEHRVEGKDSVKLTKEATELLERVVERYGDLPYVNIDGVGWVTLGPAAKEELATLRRWVELIGKTAPDIDGEDVDGKPMKLSAFRGKVVVLSFWFSDCSPCRKMIPDEKALVKRLEGKPFVLLGVNNDKDRDKAKALVDKEGMSWRSWYDLPARGSIADRWGVEGWPTVFVLDHKGLVRYRGALRVIDDTAEKSLEEAVEALLKEIEAKK